MRTFLIVVGAIALVAPMSLAQYATNFEALNASPAGVLLTDATTVTPVGTACGLLPAASQDCYYLPAATTAPFSVFKYAGNPLGISGNPLGGCNFAGCQGIPGLILGRAQREFNTIGMTTATFRADVCVKYNGTPVTALNNAASISFQPSAAAGAIPASKYMILLATWAGTLNGATWNAIYVRASALGAATTANQIPANPAFSNRPANVWNRWEVDVNFSTHAILALRITDLTTGITDTEIPATPMYLIGPLTAPNPIAYRLFAGQLGNVLAADNVCIDATGVCPGLPALPAPTEYQVNGAGAALDINGVLSNPWCKALSTHPAGSPVNINLTDTGPGALGMEVAFHVGGLVSASAGGFNVAGLGIVNVDLVTNPTLAFFNGGSAALFVPFPTGTISFGAPAGPFTLAIQMVTIVPGAPLGLGLSQGGEMLFP